MLRVLGLAYTAPFLPIFFRFTCMGCAKFTNEDEILVLALLQQGMAVIYVAEVKEREGKSLCCLPPAR